MLRFPLAAAVLLVLYVGLALSPVAIAARSGLPPRPFLDDFSSGLAMVGFVILLLEFVLSGRFRLFSTTFGIDLAMQLHQLLARTAVVLLLLHPVLYTLPTKPPLPWDWTGQLTLNLTPAATVSGLLAWGLLAVLVAAALCRNMTTWRYETWRLLHGVGALLIAALALHHALDAGRYSQLPALQAFWWAAVGFAGASLALVYGWRPLAQRRRRYTVAAVTHVADRIWEVTLEPATAAPAAYRAGQFAWLKLGSPRPLHENPFSYSSAPAAQHASLRFLIKEAGDFTRRIGSVQPGTDAYLDGPHGHFTLRSGGEGIALIAGGIGIAPILSLLRQLAASDDPRPVILVYGNRIREQAIDVETLANTARLKRFTYHPVLSEPDDAWRGLKGELDAATLEKCLPQERASAWTYYVCGPVPMIDSVERALDTLGVPLRQIVSEKFQYDFGNRTPRNRRTLALWLAISSGLVLAAALFAWW